MIPPKNPRDIRYEGKKKLIKISDQNQPSRISGSQ